MMRPYAEVIGDPIAHSKSPPIHNFWLAKLGIDAEYRATHVRAEELADYFAQRRKDANWRGCNVTMPHKQAVKAHLDTVSRDASRVGAVNCVYVQQDRLVGANTDVEGVREALAEGKPSVGDYPNHVATYAQIIGTGGAARAVAEAIQCDLEFYGRDPAKAKALATECGLPEWFGLAIEDLGPIRNRGDGLDEQRYSHIVINATPLGMAGQPALFIDLSAYYPDTLVFDMVYAPLETPLLAQARALGLRTVDGLAMLIGQAAEAFRLFFGQPAPREHDAELRALLTA